MKHLISILTITTVGLLGCGESTVTQEVYDNMVSEKDLRISELESQILKMQEHISNLESKTEEVNNQFERLETENWRDVVPAAGASLEDLNNEITNGEDISSY